VPEPEVVAHLVRDDHGAQRVRRRFDFVDGTVIRRVAHDAQVRSPGDAGLT
jgi:hypothetical protein